MMKVTKTLKSAIERMVNEKKAKEVELLEKQYQERIDAQIPDMAAALVKIRCYDIGRILLRNFGSSYRQNDEPISSADFIKRNQVRFFESEFSHLRKTIDALAIKYEKELENLLIAVEYEKDLDAVKEVFAQRGYTF